VNLVTPEDASNHWTVALPLSVHRGGSIVATYSVLIEGPEPFGFGEKTEADAVAVSIGKAFESFNPGGDARAVGDKIELARPDNTVYAIVRVMADTAAPEV
jgi:hypothetical protein